MWLVRYIAKMAEVYDREPRQMFWELLLWFFVFDGLLALLFLIVEAFLVNLHQL